MAFRSRLTATVAELEQQAEDHQTQLIRLHEALREQQKQEHKYKQSSRHTESSNTLRRYHSFENGFLDKITDVNENPYEAEIKR